MCLALPAKIEDIIDKERAIVNLGGITKEISISLLDKVSIGDYIILHVGYALAKLDEAEAKKTIALFEAMLEDQNNEIH